MGIKSVFGKLIGGLAKIAGPVLKLTEAINLLLTLITVKVATRDLPVLREAFALGVELGELFTQLGHEIIELFTVALSSISEDSDGGTAMTGNEIKEIAAEADDILPVTTEITAKLAALIAKIKALF